MADIQVAVQLNDRASRQLRNIDKAAKSLTGSFRAVGAAALAFATAGVARGVIEQYTAFEKYRSVLTTYLGSQNKANAALGRLQKLANNLPQDLNDITQAFTVLQRNGIDTSSESLTAFSNIATGNAKTFTQLAEAVADGLTGEFERFKEFGIKVTRENDKFVAKIAGQQDILADSSSDLINQLRKLGEEGGKFGSAAADNAGTLGQSFSNLRGAISEVIVAFGDEAKGGLKTFADTMAVLIRQNKEMFESFGRVAGVLGTKLAQALALTVKFMDELKTALLAFLALKAGQMFATLALQTTKFGGALKLTGAAAINVSRALKKNLVGVILALGVALADVTGVLDKLFAKMGMGAEDPFATALEGVQRLNGEMGEFSERSNEALKNSGNQLGTFNLRALATVDALKKMTNARKAELQAAEAKYELSIRNNEIDVQALSDMNRLTGEVRAAESAVSDYVRALEAYNGPLRIEVTSGQGLTAAQVELQKLIKTTDTKIASDQLSRETLKLLDREYAEGLLSIEQYRVAKELLIGTAEAEKTASQTVIENLREQKRAYDDLTGTLGDQKRLQAAAERTGLSVGMITEALNEERDGYEQFLSDAERIQRSFAERMKSAGESLSRSLAEGLVYGKSIMGSLKDMIKQTMVDILQSIINSGIQRALAGVLGGPMGGGSLLGGGGGLLGSIFGGMGMSTLIPGFGILAGIGGLLGGLFADGGNTASAGRKPILVGERGPELFMPGQAGNVVPNDQLNSGQDGLTVNFTLNAIDTQTGVQFLLENKRTITGVIQEAYQRRGAQGPIG